MEIYEISRPPVWKQVLAVQNLAPWNVTKVSILA
jgi:hypothetical protein